MSNTFVIPARAGIQSRSERVYSIPRRGRLGMLAALLLAACGPRDQARAESAAVDSFSTMAISLARFRAGLTRPEALSGPSSLDGLGASFARALAGSDRDALARLAVDQAEFAYLYFESSPQSRPPYELPPEVAWLQLTAQRDRGLSRLLEASGGRPVDGRIRCEPARAEGENRIHPRCVLAGPGTLVTLGSVMERDGRFKVLAYQEE